MNCPPVLLLAFNRPETTRRVLATLRQARPGRLFFAVDGPRNGTPDDRARVEAVRALSGTIDWECETKTLFRSSNMGCKLGVSDAITWFFGQVEAGIVMEDDCVPDATFFPFVAELLGRYAADDRIALVSGNNFQKRHGTGYSYYFSRYAHIWGWASWRRAWALYDHKMAAWPGLRDGGWLDAQLADRDAVRYWTRVFDDTYMERNSSWGYRWLFSCWSNGRLAVHPEVNLVTNIGFGHDATHTTDSASDLGRLKLRSIAFPLEHPPAVVRDAAADDYTQKRVYGSPSLVRRAVRKTAAVVRRLSSAAR